MTTENTSPESNENLQDTLASLGERIIASGEITIPLKELTAQQLKGLFDLGIFDDMDVHAYPAPEYVSGLELVREFHETYGQPIRTAPEFNVPERQLRIDLIVEEDQELEDAHQNNDFVEIADALADLLYVTYGASHTHGTNPDALLGATASPTSILRQQFLANGGVIPQRPTLDVEARNTLIENVHRATADYNIAAQQGRVSFLNRSLANLIKACYEAAFGFGIDIDDILLEVQRSNMSKLGADGKPMYRADGKVIKGPNFSEPDLATVLKNQGWRAN